MVEESDNQCYGVKENAHPYKLNHDGLVCQFCGKECKNRNSLCNHERLCKLNPNRQLTKYEKYGPIDGFNNKGRTAWNNGLTKETDNRVKKISESAKIYYETHDGTFLGKSHTEETKIKISMSSQDRCKKLGTNLCGKGKRGIYKWILCQSSWELAWVLYQIDKGVNFVRNTRYFYYTFDGSTKLYYPDFYLPEIDTYVEIKGYYDKKTQAKVEQFNGILVVLQLNEMKPILKYVVDKYGESFTDLYDKKYF